MEHGRLVEPELVDEGLDRRLLGSAPGRDQEPRARLLLIGLLEGAHEHVDVGSLLEIAEREHHDRVLGPAEPPSQPGLVGALRTESVQVRVPHDEGDARGVGAGLDGGRRDRFRVDDQPVGGGEDGPAASPARLDLRIDEHVAPPRADHERVNVRLRRPPAVGHGHVRVHDVRSHPVGERADCAAESEAADAAQARDRVQTAHVVDMHPVHVLRSDRDPVRHDVQLVPPIGQASRPAHRMDRLTVRDRQDPERPLPHGNGR